MTDYFAAFDMSISESGGIYKQLPSGSFRSDFFSVVHVVGGSMTVRLNFREYTLGPGGIFISEPYCLKQVVEVSKDCHLCGVSFTYDIFRELNFPERTVELINSMSDGIFRLLQLTVSDSISFLAHTKAIETRLKSLNTKTFGRELLANSISDFFYELAGMDVKEREQVDLVYGRKELLTAKFIRLALEHHKTRKRLDFYSDILCVTSKHLSETMKQVCGKTAGQLL